VAPAQAGAFLIAHRLRRPRPCEMAGMLDAYRLLGPSLPNTGRRAVSFGTPFDGRCRDAPVLPLTALLLNAAGVAVPSISVSTADGVSTCRPRRSRPPLAPPRSALAGGGGLVGRGRAAGARALARLFFPPQTL
jgi:hypothetical protein